MAGASRRHVKACVIIAAVDGSFQADASPNLLIRREGASVWLKVSVKIIFPSPWRDDRESLSFPFHGEFPKRGNGKSISRGCREIARAIEFETERGLSRGEPV